MHAQVNRDGDSRRQCHQFYPLHLYNFSSTADGIVTDFTSLDIKDYTLPYHRTISPLHKVDSQV